MLQRVTLKRLGALLKAGGDRLPGLHRGRPNKELHVRNPGLADKLSAGVVWDSALILWADAVDPARPCREGNHALISGSWRQLQIQPASRLPVVRWRSPENLR